MVKKKTTKRKASSTNRWFIKIRGSYLPVSWQGWLTYLPFIAYLVAVMVTISGQDLPWFNKFMMIFGQFVAAAIVMTWIASKNS